MPASEVFEQTPSNATPLDENIANWRYDIILVVYTLVVVSFALVFYRYGLFLEKWNLVAALSTLFLLTPVIANLKANSRGIISAPVRSFLIFVVLISTCATMVTLQNWQQVQYMLLERPIYSILALFISALFVFIILRELEEKRLQFKCVGWMRCLTLIPWVLFYIFARRTDSLFVETTAYHWEYLIGPIRTIRNGGILLWDTPSQYGFLTALIPALFTTGNSWDAFYYFQSILLFLSSGFFYITLTRWLHIGRCISCILVTATFYIAYPTLIGPSPYPSSSAVRFIPCYALLILAAQCFLGSNPSMIRFIAVGSFIWTFSMLWSAESGIYATVIFWAPICLHLLVGQNTKNQISPSVWICFSIPIAVFLASAAIFICAYHSITQQSPDLTMMFLYSAAYSAGFGSIAIPVFGAIWFYVLLILLCALSLRAALVHNYTACGPAGAAIAAMGCILIISTYYIGRAVPNNVVAEYGLLVFCFILIARVSIVRGRISIASRSAAFPILMVAMLSPFWNAKFPGVISAIIEPQSSAPTKLPPADDELVSLLSTAGITPETPVVYYGYDAFMPPMRTTNGSVITFERTWLPGPLQLLEEPISPLVRERIIERYRARISTAGFLIWKRGEAQDRFSQWIELLDRFYSINQIWETNHYRVFQFTPRLTLSP